MFSPLVSVVVPCYNAEKYIKYTIDSIEQQSYQNFEVICVDDGSTDQTQKILTDYSKTYKNIKVIKQANSGVAIARNVGFSHSNGKFIYFCDSDDTLHHDTIKILVDALENSNADICCCQFNKMHNKKTIGSNKIRDYKTKIFSDFDKFVSYAMKNWRYNFMPWGKLYKKSIIDKVFVGNNLFNKKMQTLEDLPFFIQYSNSCKKYCLVNKRLVNYRIRQDSLSMRKNSTPNKSKIDSKIYSINQIHKLKTTFPKLKLGLHMINSLICECSYLIILEAISVKAEKHKIINLYTIYKDAFHNIFNNKVVPWYKKINIKSKNKKLVKVINQYLSCKSI